MIAEVSLRKSIFYHPAANDPVYRFFAVPLGEKAIPAALLYFLFSFGGTILLSLAGGTLYRNGSLIPLSHDYLNLINLGLLSPLGAIVTVNFYRRLSRFLRCLVRGDWGSDTEGAAELHSMVKPMYQSSLASWLSFISGSVIAVISMLLRPGWWLGIHGGFTAFYARIFICLNYGVIILMLYKSLVTGFLLLRTMRLGLRIRPLHPDRCGGLKVIGDLSLSMHYFLTVVLLYLGLLALFEPECQQNPVFWFMFFLVLLVALSSPVYSLAGVHRMMQATRQRMLLRLSSSLQNSLEKVPGGDDLAAMQSVQGLTELYRLAESMPVWPYEFGSMARLISSIIMTPLAMLINMLSSGDSLVSHLDKLRFWGN
ncbi:MAG: hypothetical protein PHW04_13050 [Candidatus Wallbacteria bacterium]|nr:hypothetical protein [Candidatus Wallbacteria bacterium]